MTGTAWKDGEIDNTAVPEHPAGNWTYSYVRTRVNIRNIRQISSILLYSRRVWSPSIQISTLVRPPSVDREGIS